MTTIRPNVFPQTPQRPQGHEAGRAAAQRAFFAAAMGQGQAATATVAPAAAEAPATAPVAARTAATSADAPQKILRPGSLIDIRV